jgi:hypothetical protein
MSVIGQSRRAPYFLLMGCRIVLPMAACQSQFAIGQPEFRLESAVALFNRAARH